MTAKLCHLDWDTEFFGFPIGKINIEQSSDVDPETLKHLLLDARSQRIKLVYVCSRNALNLPAEIIELCVHAQLVDQKATYAIELAGKYHKDKSIQTYDSDTVSPDLLRLALASGEHSRFRLDSRFPQGSFEKLYAIWIENSINGKIAESVLVYRIGDHIVGMVTLGSKDGSGQIGLIAVDAQHRGQKIGQKLINAGKAYFSQRNVSRLTVATQLSNEAACRFYERNGFGNKTVEAIWHCWL